MTSIALAPPRNKSPRLGLRLAHLLDPLPTFEAHRPGSAGRGAVERYIAAQFETVHGAHIHDFMPLLLTMQCGDEPSAAAGMRPALAGPLFLERYLPQPVESVLSARSGRDVRRDGVVEIGNLVATRKGSNYLLFLVLAAVLRQLDFQWCVFTATPPVLSVLHRLGVELQVLCAADLGCIREGDRADWGRYYEQRPLVVAGEIAPNVDALQHRLLTAGVLSLFQQPVAALSAAIAAMPFVPPQRDSHA